MNNINNFIKKILKVSIEKEFSFHHLGIVGSDTIHFIKSNGKVDYPNILIAAGFHGDEPAGPLSILAFLEQLDIKDISNINLSFLPLVNPSGFRNITHCNDWGENPNRGFCNLKVNEKLSLEGKVLMENLEILKESSKDGFISLHEDADEKHSYLYTYEKSDKIGPFSLMLRNIILKHFTMLPDGNNPIVGNIVNNIIFNDCDGSLEDRLFHEGSSFAACTETPGKHGLSKRITADVEIIKAFINFSIGGN
jgi:hypothetical protein